MVRKGRCYPKRNRNTDEQEAAKCLLELANKDIVQVAEKAEETPAKQEPLKVPKKRGRKPKVKKNLPVLMKQTQKVFKNYQKRYKDKILEAPILVESEAGEKLDWEKCLSGCDPEDVNQNNTISTSLADANDSSSSDTSLDSKIGKIRLTKGSDGACWSSSVLKSSTLLDTHLKEEDAGSNSFLLPLEAVPASLPHSSSMDTLPPNWLPFKKRKLHLTGQLEDPFQKASSTNEWQPPSPESLRESSEPDPLNLDSDSEGALVIAEDEKKPSILEQACMAAGIGKCEDSSDDLQVIYDVKDSGGGVPLEPVVDTTKVACVAQKLASFPPTPSFRSMTAAFTKPVVACSVYTVPEPPLTEPTPEQQPLNLCSKKKSVTVVSADFMSCKNSLAFSLPVSYPQFTSQVLFRILSDNWRVLPKFSVYEMQPFHFQGQMSRCMVSTFVLFHKQRSETKSLHFLNRFPTQCEVKFEYLHSMVNHPIRGDMKLPDHLAFQPVSDEQFSCKQNLDMLKSYFPGSPIFSVHEDQKLVVNKVAVSEVSETTGAAHIKVYAFSSAMLDRSWKPTEKTFDTWFSKTDTVEVYRLTIPAWMMFSREIIRLHIV